MLTQIRMNDKHVTTIPTTTTSDGDTDETSSQQQQSSKTTTTTTTSKMKRSYVSNQMNKLGLSVDSMKQILNETSHQRQHRSHVNTSTGNTSGSHSDAESNPFKLVSCQQYTNESMQPFACRLSMEALAIMDIHSHCVRTEVIGLLGGIYCARTQQLFILTAEPCVSMSDHHLQCDMEPVSQALAKQSLEDKNYSVVGWYHSHPTFAPNPSLRDLETQHVFQSMFKSESNQPFIAFILSPYYYTPSSSSSSSSSMSSCIEYHSKFKCLIVSDSETIHYQQTVYRKPYELIPQIIRREKLMFSVITKLKHLCEKIRENNSQSAIDLFDLINTNNSNNNIRSHNQQSINYLQKLCLSLRHYLMECGMSSVECDFMIDNCKSILCDQSKLNHQN